MFTNLVNLFANRNQRIYKINGIAFKTVFCFFYSIIVDAETLEHLQIKGLYPCGEGAGYAGGIISAAIDGEKCALKIGEVLKKDL
jgi:uncharacterized FAD-dependent dehydrogenase